MRILRLCMYVLLLSLAIFFIPSCNSLPIEPNPGNTHTPIHPTITTTRTSTLLPATITSSPTPIVVACAKADVNIRPIPSVEQERVGILTYKTCKQIIGFNEDKTWVQIDEGWVKLEFLDLTENPNPLISPSQMDITKTPSKSVITQTKTLTKKYTQTSIPKKTPTPTNTTQIVTQAKLSEFIDVFKNSGFNFSSSSIDNSTGLTCYEGNNRSDGGNATIILCGEENSTHGGTLILNMKDDAMNNAALSYFFIHGMLRGWEDAQDWVTNAIEQIETAHKTGIPIHAVEKSIYGYHILVVGNSNIDYLGLMVEDEKYSN